ncbi:fibronectin type III domain-containing protein [Brevibacillus formosus]|uniref:fibronectin type III domain-containing protein n=1 Tax=Brevibacillus formosus TaxID=54913 RepID=UPI003B5CF0C5
MVTYQGQDYKCTFAHTSLVGWEPPNVPTLWQLQGPSAPDTIPPTSPTNLREVGISSSSVSLTWSASTDNIAVQEYLVYNGDTLAGTSSTTSYTVTGLLPNTTYSFTIQAKDAAGNVSPPSASIIHLAHLSF